MKRGKITDVSIGEAIDTPPSTVRLTLSALIMEQIVTGPHGFQEEYRLNPAMSNEAQTIINLLDP